MPQEKPVLGKKKEVYAFKHICPVEVWLIQPGAMATISDNGRAVQTASLSSSRAFSAGDRKWSDVSSRSEATPVSSDAPVLCFPLQPENGQQQASDGKCPPPSRLLEV